MGVVIPFRRRRHAASISAKASNVMREHRSRLQAERCLATGGDGIRARRQVLTVEAGSPSLSDTAPVPPRSSNHNCSGVRHEPEYSSAYRELVKGSHRAK